MKTRLILVMFFLIICKLSFSAIPDSGDQMIPATIYFFRLPNYAGSATKMTILSNDQPIVKLKNAACFKYEVQPGDYTFTLSFGSSAKIKLSVESGKEYYIKCYYNMGFWSGIPILEPIDAVSGKAIIEGNNLFAQQPEPIDQKERNSRVGLFMGGGIGFETYPWFIDEGGDDVTLSTGGGFAIGGEYGHQFGRSFDLSLNCFFEGSSLSENLKNASASFNRMGITVTPAVIIPVKGGKTLRFRLGAGAGLYAFGTMKIDASEINGSKYVFKYDPAIGIHGQLLFESNFSEKGSMNMGIRYNNINYQYTTTGSSHNVTDPKLLKPKGSSIDFVLGYNLHF